MRKYNIGHNDADDDGDNYGVDNGDDNIVAWWRWWWLFVDVTYDD